MRRLMSCVLCCAAYLVAPSSYGEELHSYTGAELYKRFCASCHGANGEGDGPVAPALKAMVPDLRLIARRQGGKYPAEQIRRIIDGRDIKAPHGSRDMPVWGWEFQQAGQQPGQQPNDLIERLVKHLGTLQKH
jgi:mono/diheme cytochrome c family protein